MKHSKKTGTATASSISRRRFLTQGSSTLCTAALISGGVLTSSRRAWSAPKIKMRLSISTKRGWHSTDAAFSYFPDLVKEMTNGEMEIQPFAGGSLGGVDVPGTEGCVNGLWEFATCAATNFSNFTSAFRATELPYIFLTKEDTYRAIDGAPGQYISGEVEKVGLKLLQVHDYGFRNYFNNVRPVHTPADMKGQKVRTSYSPIEIAIIESQGANPTPVSWAEVIPSLAQGVVDGTGNADDLIQASGQYEVLKYATETKYMYTYNNLVMNKGAYDGLPADFQNVIDEASRQTVAWQREQATQAVEKAWKIMGEKGIERYTPTAEEMDLFVKATKPVWDNNVKEGEADPALVKQILEMQDRSIDEIFKG
ncbi:TRAP transporter substrate-binding protein [Oricola indica]|uniref:TRAP transporter substrate-binding protein n=1 Tax=Oricola indica TaxID=2872591 RepID=UPI003CCB9CE8